jgi:outer membrane protein assembly factor BamB
VLTSRNLGNNVEIAGLDVTSGAQVWRRTFEADEPECATGRGDTFVTMGDGVPLVLNARTGATVVAASVSACLTVDPVSATGVRTSSGLAAYDLGTGAELWKRSASDTRSVSLSVRSVYDGRIYVTTRTVRLVLDARSGRQLDTGWTRAPKATFDGWSIWYTDRGDLVAVPG